MPRLAALQTEPDDYLILPIAGGDGVVRDYTIPPVPGEAWYRASALGDTVLLAMMNVRPRQRDLEMVKDLSVDDQYRLVLSDGVVDAMMADKVPGKHIQRAFLAGVMFVATGGDLDRANAVWSGKGTAPIPAAPAANSKTSRRKS